MEGNPLGEWSPVERAPPGRVVFLESILLEQRLSLGVIHMLGDFLEEQVLERAIFVESERTSWRAGLLEDEVEVASAVVVEAASAVGEAAAEAAPAMTLPAASSPRRLAHEVRVSGVRSPAVKGWCATPFLAQSWKLLLMHSCSRRHVT